MDAVLITLIIVAALVVALLCLRIIKDSERYATALPGETLIYSSRLSGPCSVQRADWGRTSVMP